MEPGDLPDALAAALADGPPIAPLPPPGPEREQSLTMLRPDEPVEADAAVVVSTSGSTGHPKGVLLSARAIRAAAAAAHERLGGPADWVLCLPAHYVAGLMVLARAHLGGTTALPARPDLTDLAAVTERLRREGMGHRYLSIVPTQLARALDRPALADTLRDFDAVLVGGGALAPSLAAAAGQAGVRLVTSYGMSETCGGCVYDGVPLTGVDVTLGSPPRSPEAAEGPEPVAGRISIGGASLFSGYRRRPDLTADAVHQGRLVTADRGRWDDGRLSILGRLDDVVVSGGMNVDLTEVERAVRSWPELGSADVAVVGVPDAEWGTAVVAVVETVLADPEAATRLRAHLRDRLPTYAAPRAVLGQTSLPRTSGGKIDRRRLVADLTARPSSTALPHHTEQETP